MTCEDFYRLAYTQQADLLLEHGRYLQTRSEGNFIIDLYELHNLLVEIFYQSENEEPVSVMAYDLSAQTASAGSTNLCPRPESSHTILPTHDNFSFRVHTKKIPLVRRDNYFRRF